MALLIRLIMALFTRPEIGLFHPTLTPVWNHHRLVTGMVLSITGAAVFIMTRQPYAGILCLAMLVVKGLLIGKGKGVS